MTKFTDQNADYALEDRLEQRALARAETEFRRKGKRETVYIAGPMRGYAAFNFPAFMAAEERLAGAGWRVLNPARMDNETYGGDVSKDNLTGSEETAAAQYGFSIREALGRDAQAITQEADAVYMLKGWEGSTGAQAEWALARALGLRIMYEM